MREFIMRILFNSEIDLNLLIELEYFEEEFALIAPNFLS